MCARFVLYHVHLLSLFPQRGNSTREAAIDCSAVPAVRLLPAVASQVQGHADCSAMVGGGP